MIRICGVDISHWNGNIDWATFKAKSGKKFVIIKCGGREGGKFYSDNKFNTNRTGAQKVGVPVVGFYYFAQGVNAQEEAKHFKQIVGELKNNELIVLDFEPKGQVGGVTAAGVKFCLDFLNKCTELFGTKPLIYLNKSQVKSANWTSVAAANYGLWLASYDNSLEIQPTAAYWPFVAMKQFTNAGKVEGIPSARTDVNTFFGSVDQLKKYCKQISMPISEPAVETLATIKAEIDKLKTELAQKDSEIMFLKDKVDELNTINANLSESKLDFQKRLELLQQKINDGELSGTVEITWAHVIKKILSPKKPLYIPTTK